MKRIGSFNIVEPPPSWVVALVSAALIFAAAAVQFKLLDGTILPIGYGLPIIIFVWLRDRRFLWTTAACFAAVSSVKFFVLASAGPPVFISPYLGFAVQIVDLFFVTAVVHVLIGTRKSLEGGIAALEENVEQMRAKEEEIARQNEELQSQTEELERQSEELRIANDELAAREKTLEHLLALSRSLAGELTHDQVLSLVCEALGYLLGNRAAGSAILERRGNHVEVTCHHGFGPDGLLEAKIPTEQAFSAVVMNRAQAAYLENIALRPDLQVPQPKQGERMKSVLAAPLRVYGRTVGTLEVYSREEGSWAEEHVALLESLAAQASISLEAAELFNDVDRERRRFESVFKTLPIGVVVANEDYSEVRMNPAAAAMFGVSSDENHGAVARRGGWRITHGGRQLAPEQYPLWRAVKEGEETRNVEVEVHANNGRRFTMLVSASPIRDKDGKILGGVKTFTDITDRKALERELDQRRREAEEAAMRKTRFLAAVSHDIRTPANAINLMAELIRRTAANPGMASEIPSLATELQSSASSLVSLVSDVLDLTRFETGRIELNETEFQLGEAVSEEIRQLTPVASAKGLSLKYESPDPEISVRSDRVKLSRVLANLVGNAIKFTHHGEVSVSVTLGSDQRAHIHVRDCGVGIDPQHLPRIFDEFFQLRNPERDPAKGAGLGLTICKRLVDAMGGELLVESTPGKGSVFSLILPASTVTAHQAAASRAALAPQRREGRIDGVKILLVEDDDVTRGAARMLLRSFGAHVSEAATVSQAITALQNTVPEVLLLDLVLPDGNGLDVLKSLHPRRPAGLRKILVLTGDVAGGTITQVRDLGADGLIPKPIGMPALLEAIGSG